MTRRGGPTVSAARTARRGPGRAAPGPGNRRSPRGREPLPGPGVHVGAPDAGLRRVGAPGQQPGHDPGLHVAGPGDAESGSAALDDPGVPRGVTTCLLVPPHSTTTRARSATRRAAGRGSRATSSGPSPAVCASSSGFTVSTARALEVVQPLGCSVRYAEPRASTTRGHSQPGQHALQQGDAGRRGRRTRAPPAPRRPLRPGRPLAPRLRRQAAPRRWGGRSPAPPAGRRPARRRRAPPVATASLPAPARSAASPASRAAPVVCCVPRRPAAGRGTPCRSPGSGSGQSRSPAGVTTSGSGSRRPAPLGGPRG